jgi:hypothetical protein
LLGPVDGRYLTRPDDTGGAAQEVIVFRTLAVERRPARRVKRAEGDEQDIGTAPLSRVTVIGAQRLTDADAAREWLGRARGKEAESEVERALRCINRAVQGHRIAAHDPYVGEVSRGQAHRVRIGYGTGDELVEGGFSEAYVVPPPGRRTARRQALAPQEELAGILGGRRPALPSEDLLLRARLDLAEGRSRLAAQQAGAAASALICELEGDGLLPPEARTWLDERVPLAERLSAAARAADLTTEQAGELDDLVAGMERIVRRRRLAAGQ